MCLIIIEFVEFYGFCFNFEANAKTICRDVISLEKMDQIHCRAYIYILEHLLVFNSN